MKKTHRKPFPLHFVAMAIMTIAIILASIPNAIGVRVSVSCGGVVMVGCLYAIRWCVRQKDFSYRTMIRFKKAGLTCAKSADGFVVKQGNLVIRAKMWNNANGLKHVHFALDFAPQSLDSVLPEGWAMLATQCNATYDHTIVKFYGDHFSCMVETSVKNARDFLAEYRFAVDRISETVQGMEENAPRVVSQFPTRKRIGFAI